MAGPFFHDEVNIKATLARHYIDVDGPSILFGTCSCGFVYTEGIDGETEKAEEKAVARWTEHFIKELRGPALS